MVKSKHIDNKNIMFVIDEDFRIVHAGGELKSGISEMVKDKYCYKIFGNKKCQCQNCPLKKENQGQTIMYNHMIEEWVSVQSAPFDFPGVGPAHVIIESVIENHDKSMYFDIADRADYDELLELNYLENSYRVVYHGVQSKGINEATGIIDTMVHHVAEKQIHPDDREHFCDFWMLNHVGQKGIPEELLAPRHGEFRKLKEDGSYQWVQQIMVPVRNSSKNAIFINSFYNVIDVPGVPGAPAGNSLGETTNPLYNKKGFFRNVDKELQKTAQDETRFMISIDIEKFKLFNEWYGEKAGDELLKELCRFLKQFQDESDGIAGYLGDDDFALFTSYDEQQIGQLYQEIAALIKAHSGKMKVLPALGIYEITDKTEEAFKAYNRAKLACDSIKGNYAMRIKRFDREMLENLESEYLLLSDIQNAFKNKEFVFFLQPKCDMRNGKIVGAEALARWESKEKGMIPPGVFIPFLEKSGFVAELDTYIWEEVCKWQRDRIDKGVSVIPVSVNVSRTDLYSVNVPEYFADLVKKYDLDPKLIEIEITESAYAEDDGLVKSTVNRLRKSGFHVLMDDFGSAYSSLNMLKDIAVDTLKIDMRFLEFHGDNKAKGIDILGTVCNMANILGLGIVVEGVETQEQKDFLLAMKCTYGQGYYFYRPLPVSDFENIIENNLDTEEIKDEKIERLYLKDLLGKDMFSEIMINNMLGAVVFYDVYEGQINVIRYNEQYASLVGSNDFASETSIRFGSQLYQEDFQKIFQMFEEAQNNRHEGAEVDIRRHKQDGTDMWMHLKTFFLHKQNGHAIYYSSASDVTKIHKSNDALQFLNNDMPGGYYRHKHNEDCEFTHISKRFLDILGYTRAEIKAEFDDKFMNMIHPEDRARLRQSINSLENIGGNYSLPCRIRAKNGYILVVNQSRLVRYEGLEIFQGLILYDLEHYKWLGVDSGDVHENNIAMKLMPCGIFFSEADDDHAFHYVSSSMLQMLGYTKAEFLKKFPDTDSLIYKEDLPRVDGEIKQQIQNSNYTSCEYRVEMADGSLKWVYSRGHLITDENGKRWFCVCIIDHDYLKEKYRYQELQHLKYRSLFEVPGMMVFDYDPQIDCFTIEMSAENGQSEILSFENYIEKMEEHGLLFEACVEEQKSLMLDALKYGINGMTEVKMRFHKEDDYQWYRFRYITLVDEDGKGVRLVGRAENINNEVNVLSDWKNLAMTDSLTKLWNYESAKEKIDKFIHSGDSGTLFVLDLDNFKSVNDSLGHLSGDILLKDVAELIQASFNEEEVIARFGGDEFLVFAPGNLSKEQAEQKAENLIEAIAQILLPENKNVQCSIGIAAVTDPELSFDELFEQADIALYQAKSNGKNTYAFFNGGGQRPIGRK